MNAILEETAIDGSTDVRAVLNYTRKTGIRPVNYTFDPPRGIPRSSGELDPRPVTVHDARKVPGLGLDVSGFELIEHRSTLADWASFRDGEQVKAIDYPEVEAALKARTRADKVVLFDHTLRDSTAEPGRPALREPVLRVHDDQTFRSAPERVRKHLSPEEAARRLQRRFAIINFWRPVGGPVLRAPLAVCDARTIAPEDLLASDLVYPDWTGETYAIAFNPGHRWYWHPRQTPTEATLIKVYDSATDCTARLSAHTAFEDPTTVPDAPPRRSIEIRALVFW
ncbi:MAG TPA: CmcJ/NvfI family oxidoreductase [Steroidobacteraceae bacterium]|nr:CmcJ/NvfI family oxidoreductase [Steroidobacteraceae bacterium]